jgi:hypothetical protein
MKTSRTPSLSLYPSFKFRSCELCMLKLPDVVNLDREGATVEPPPRHKFMQMLAALPYASKVPNLPPPPRRIESYN